MYRILVLLVKFKLFKLYLVGDVVVLVLLLVMGAEAAMTGGWVMTVVTVLLWDLLFLLTDRLLGMPMKKR